MSKWHKGPPPSVGWWPASVCKDPNAIRWWNGYWWSLTCRPSTPAAFAASAASHPTGATDIEWMDRPDSWPARSRT